MKRRPSSLPASPCGRSRPQAFTLFELLAVVAVIVIMIGLLGPAVTNFGKATALATAGSTVANLAGFARQNSITKGTMTALVLLGDQGTDYSPDDQLHYFRSFTLVEYEEGVGWKQIHPWQTLPTGVIVDPIDLANCSFLNPAYSTQRFPFWEEHRGQGDPPVNFRGRQIKNGMGFAARIFMPSGSLRNPEIPAQIRLVEGVWQNGNLARTRPEPGGLTSANYYDIAILGATGIVKASRR